MKKIFLIAASAMMVLASCTKVDINYPDNGQPQEIALFSINKNMVKAPVVGEDFLDTDNMRVSAYLAQTGDGNNTGSYFTNVLFSKNGGYWTGGWYWPLSSATMNFVAVTQKGGGVDLTEDEIDWPDNKFTVTVDYNTAGNATANPPVPQTYNQSDIMYASVRASNSGNGTAPGAVGLVFKHALAWINFAFKTNVEDVITIKSVELTARYNGTLTVTPSNYTSPTGELSATASWSEKNADEVIGIKVPNALNDAVMGDLPVLKSDYTSYGNGLLVVPGTSSDSDTFFTIVYTIKQNNGNPVEYTYKHLLKNTTWEEGKKYTYNININLHEIEVSPSVTTWDDANATTEVPLG